MKIKVLLKVRYKNIVSLNDKLREGFQVFICRKQWKCYAAGASCCDIPEGRDMFAVKYGGTLLPCNHYLLCKDDMFACANGAIR